MESFRNTSFSVYLADGSRCRGEFYPGDARPSGAPVGVHIHGFRSSSAHTKARYFRDHAIARAYSWATFDLPCHGRSEGRFRAFRVSAALEAVLEVVHLFRPAPVLLLGSSLGGWLAMLAARKLAQQAHARNLQSNIAGAVLIAPAFDFFQHYYRAESPDAMQRWRRDGVRNFTDHYDHARYQLDYAAVTDGLAHGILEQPTAWDFPVRIFHGDHDEIAPIAHSRRFHEISADADVKLHTIPGGDHTLSAHLRRIAAEVDGMFDALTDGARIAEVV